MGGLRARDGSAGARTFVFADGERILMPLGEPYRPWRTAATWYMWRALEDGNAMSTRP